MPDPSPSAFPHFYPGNTPGEIRFGMTLLDWFAGQALQGYLANGYDCTPEELALLSYQVGRAMIHARRDHPAHLCNS